MACAVEARRGASARVAARLRVPEWHEQASRWPKSVAHEALRKRKARWCGSVRPASAMLAHAGGRWPTAVACTEVAGGRIIHLQCAR